MDRSFKNMSVEELKKLFRRETKAFLDGLENGASVSELKTLRATMKEISEILEEKIKQRNKPGGS